MSQSYEVERNGVKLPLVNYKIIRGENKDKEYPAPQVTAENLASVLKWIGDSTLQGLILPKLKATFQELWLDAPLLSDGTRDVAVFLKNAADFAAVAKKLKELRDEKDELSTRVAMLLDKAETKEQFDELRGLGAAIRALNDQIEARSRKGKEMETEPAVEAA